MALLAVGVVLIGLLSPASAQPATPQSATAPTTEAEREIHQAIEDEVRVNLPDVMTTMLGEAGADPRPWGHYDLGASVGFVDRALTFQARLLFAIGRWAIGLSHFAAGWVLRFDLGRLLAPVVATLARTFQTQIVGGLQLAHLALLAAVGRGGWLLLRQRGTAGLAEIMTAVVIATAGSVAFARVDAVTCSGLDTLGGATLAILALGTSEEPTALTEIGRPNLCGDPDRPLDANRANPVAVFQDLVFTVFVVEPHLILQWGELPAEDSSCRRVADWLVAKAAWDDEDFPREIMKTAGCEGMADFNTTMGVDRVVGSFVAMLASVAFAVAVVSSVATVLVGQVAGALLVVCMPFALVAGIAPGAGRELLARWGHAVLKVAVLFLGSAFFLVMLVTGVQAMQAGLPGESVMLRMGVSAGVAWMLVLMRRNAFATLRFAAHSVASRAAGRDADVGDVGRSAGRVAVQVSQDVQDIAVGGGFVAGARAGRGLNANTQSGSRGPGPMGGGRGHRLRSAQARTAAVSVPAVRAARVAAASRVAVRGRPPATPVRRVAPRGSWDIEGQQTERALMSESLDGSLSPRAPGRPAPAASDGLA